MPRYEVTMVLTLDEESQHAAAVAADEFVEALDEGGIIEWPAGDTSLTITSISWPVDS